MAHETKRQDNCVFEFDRIEQWGPELTELFKDKLPKDLASIFSADPPDDVEHATEILIPHMFVEKLAIEKRMRKWFEGKRVTAYCGDRLTDEELKTWPGFRSDEQQIERFRAACGSHPEWAEVAGRAADMLANLTMSGQGMFGRTASASRRGAIINFDAFLSAETEVLRRVAFELLGVEGARMMRCYDEPRVLQLELLGVNALRAANRFANKRVQDPNCLIWMAFNAWAYWLADCEFSPSDEGWYVGLDLPIGEDNWRLIRSEAICLGS